MEDLPKIVQNIKEFLLEIIMWIILIPKTLTTIIVYPSFISPYIDKESEKEDKNVPAFREYINPIFLWVILIAIPGITANGLLINSFFIIKETNSYNDSLIRSQYEVLYKLDEQNPADKVRKDELQANISTLEKKKKREIFKAATEASKEYDSLKFGEKLMTSTITQMLFPLGFIITFLVLFPSYYERSKIKLILYNQLYILTPYMLLTVLATILAMSYPLYENNDYKITVAWISIGILIFFIFFTFLRTQYLFIKNFFNLGTWKALGIFVLSYFIASGCNYLYISYLIKSYS